MRGYRIGRTVVVVHNSLSVHRRGTGEGAGGGFVLEGPIARFTPPITQQAACPLISLAQTYGPQSSGFKLGSATPTGLRRNIIDYWCGKSYHIFGCRLDTSRGESDHIRNQTSTSDLGPPPFGTRGNQLECEISHGHEIPLAC